MSQNASAILSAALILALAGTTIPSLLRSRPQAPPPKVAPVAAEAQAPPAGEEIVLPPPPAFDPPKPSVDAPSPERASSIEPLRPSQPADARPLQVTPLQPSREPPARREPVAPQPAETTPSREPAAAEEAPRAIVPLKAAPPPAPPPRIAEQHVEAAPRAEPAVSAETVGREILTKGRALLRLLEHGKGPVVEIAWPAAAGERERLFNLLRSCFDLRVALVDGEGRLYFADGERGRPSDLNLDRYSGFVRQIDRSTGRGADAEERRIRDRHGDLAGARPALVLTRASDALLLGGLKHLIGPAYESEAAIRARYAMTGGRLLVEGIVAGERSVPGVIDLTGAGRRPCSAL
jgi:hypothetical protein